MKKIALLLALTLSLTSCATTTSDTTSTETPSEIFLTIPLSGEIDNKVDIQTDIPVSLITNSEKGISVAAVHISYDSEWIEVDPINTTNSAYGFFPIRTIENNQIKIVAGQENPGVEGTGKVAQFTIRMKKPGKTEININKSLSQLLIGEDIEPFETTNLILESK